jgi:hypothetical protein
MQRGAPASQSRAAVCLAPPSLSDDGGLQTRPAIDQNERLRDEIPQEEIEVQRRALEQAWVKFIEANKSGGPGVRLRETPHDRVLYPCGGASSRGHWAGGGNVLQDCLPPCLLERSMTLGDGGGRGGLTIVGHPESGLGERAHWPSGIPGGAGDEGMMDRPAFPIRLLFQLTDQRDGEARNPAPRFGRSWAFSWRGVRQSDRIDRSACDCWGQSRLEMVRNDRTASGNAGQPR